MACGAPSAIQEANAEIQVICDQVKEAAQLKSGKSFVTFIATQYKSQVVAGTNFFIKVKVGDGSFVHLRVFRSLPHAGSTLDLVAILVDKTAADELAYF